ncbi:MAG: LapA family protein [Rhizobiaceae bacterium]
MINRLVAALVFVPIAVILIALAVSNRSPASFTIDPFNPGNPALTLELPLFVWLFAALAVGMVIGSVATWFKQGKYRRGMRKSQHTVDTLREQAKATQKVTTSLPAPGE